MSIFLAMTESGADYMIDTSGGFWSYRSENYDRLMRFQVAVVNEDDETLELPWVNSSYWRDATAPVIGRRMYLASMSNWRISTPVVSVEIVKEEK